MELCGGPSGCCMPLAGGVVAAAALLALTSMGISSFFFRFRFFFGLSSAPAVADSVVL